MFQLLSSLVAAATLGGLHPGGSAIATPMVVGVVHSAHFQASQSAGKGALSAQSLNQSVAKAHLVPLATVPEEAQATYDSVAPSLVFLLSGNSIIGLATAIGDGSYFISTKNSLLDSAPQAVTESGVPLRLSKVSEDDATGFVLYKTKTPTEKVPPMKVQTDVNDAESYFAIFPESVTRVVLTGKNIIATSTNGGLPVVVNEYRFDAIPQTMVGALIVNNQGELLGLLGARLGTKPATKSTTQGAKLGGNGAESTYGPRGLFVAYSVTGSVLNNVVSQFLHGDHEVRRPSLGITCRTATDSGSNSSQSNGALIVSIVTGSPAELAGIKPGDVLVALAGESIENQLDYARIMAGLAPSQVVEIRLRRDDKLLILNLKLGTLKPSLIKLRVAKSH